MTNYRRSHVAGASYFFTVNCAARHDNQLLLEQVDLLRKVFRKVKMDHPFHVDAIVVLPEHFIASGLFHLATPIIKPAGP